METIYDHVDKKTADEFMKKYTPDLYEHFNKLSQDLHYLIIYLFYCKKEQYQKAVDYFPKLNKTDQFLYAHFLHYPFEEAFMIRP